MTPAPSSFPRRSRCRLRLALTSASLLAACLAACLAGCSEHGKETDFNAVVPKLLEPLKNKNPEDAARQMFDTTSPDERRDAIAWLNKQKYGHEPPYMRAYKVLATDPHPLVKAQAMQALGTARDPSVVPILLDGLKDKDVGVRRDASAGLILSYSEPAAEPLMDRLKNDDDRQVRINAAKALANSRTPRVIRGLIDALDDRDAGVVLTALASLERITGQHMSSDSRQWLEWYNAQRWPTPATQS